MRPLTILASVTAALAVASVTAPAQSQHAPLPPEVVALDTQEGERLFAESTARADFFRLVDTFVTQERPSFCGVASAVSVLNAVPIVAPETDVGAQFTQQNFFASEATRKIMTAEQVAKGGMTLDQLGDLLQTYAVKADVVHASDLSLEETRARLAMNLADARDFVIVNYQRGELGQESLGHISPLAAYHAASDRVLLLDVARYKYPPQWVKTDALYRAMRSNDLLSGKSRGFVMVSAAKTPPGARSGARPRSPTMILSGIIAVAFFLGVGAGFGLARLLRKPLGRDGSLNGSVNGTG